MKSAVTVAFITSLGLPSAVEGLQCKFKLAPYTYDLCPLIFNTPLSAFDSRGISRHIHIHNEVFTPPSVTHKSYDIDLGGEGLPMNTSLPTTDQCPPGTWICLKVTNTLPTRPSEPPRILQIIPVAGNMEYTNTKNETVSSLVDASARLSWPQSGSDEILPSVDIILNGGQYRFQTQRAKFTFRCDKTAEEPSTPVSALFQQDSSELDSSSANTHVFTWSTKHACPVAMDVTSVMATAPATATATPPGAPPPRKPSIDTEDSEKDDETTPEAPLNDDDVPPAYRAKPTAIIIGSLAAFALVSYGIFTIYTERRKQSYSPLSRGDPISSSTLLPRIPFTFPALPFSIRFPPFLRRLSRPNFSTRYDPLIAEEYEIQDEDVDCEVVDFQRQALLNSQRRGYGSVQ